MEENFTTTKKDPSSLYHKDKNLKQFHFFSNNVSSLIKEMVALEKLKQKQC